MRYHIYISEGIRRWNKCKAKTKESCPYKNNSHEEDTLLNEAYIYAIYKGKSHTSFRNLSEEDVLNYKISSVNNPKEVKKILSMWKGESWTEISLQTMSEQTKIANIIKEGILKKLEDVKYANFIRNSIAGKEGGHSIAATLEEDIYHILKKEGYPVCYEINAQGKPIPRSAGDMWIAEKDYINPINVKTGEWREPHTGSPNVTSMKRLLQNITTGRISAYYLAIAKFSIVENKIEPKVLFIDILNHTELLTYNQGPGQIMLKEAQLYTKLQPGKQTKESTLTIEEKLSSLLSLYNSGLQVAEQKLQKDRALITNYQKNGISKEVKPNKSFK